MNTDHETQLAELRQLRDKGLLSEAAYQAAVTGMQASYQAQVQSGAAAQGVGATAIGERGVQVHDVAGSIITGNVYYGEPTQDPAKALRIYCRVLAHSSGHLPLRGVDIGASDPASGQQPLGLAHVYIDLDTTTQIEGPGREKDRDLLQTESRPLPALSAAI